MIIPNKIEISYWKRVQSFFYDVIIDRIDEEYSLYLKLRRDRLILDSDSANQSYEELQKSFHICFQKLDVYSKEYDTVLILGFGLGSVADLLFQYSQVQRVTGIELHPKIIDWFYQYFDSKKIELKNEDAVNLKLYQRFDFILIDLFQDRKLPEFLFEMDYWVKLRSHIDSQGRIIWNTLEEHESMIPDEIKGLFHRNVRSIYGNIFWILNAPLA